MLVSRVARKNQRMHDGQQHTLECLSENSTFTCTRHNASGDNCVVSDRGFP